MSAFIQQQKCFITTLSPVHMGAGEDYYPTQYVIDDGLMYVFDELQMSQALGVSMMNDLAKLAESGRDAVSALQKKVYEKKDNLKNVADLAIPVSNGIVSKYQDAIKTTKNEMVIHRTFFNPFDNNPVITGSGIKGAIRTAILDSLNKSQPLDRKVKSSGDLQKFLLGHHNITDDPFRLLKVSDASYKHENQLQSSEVLFAVSRKRNPVVGRQPNSTTIMLECISPWRARSFTFDLSLLNRSLIVNKNTQKIPGDITAFAAVCNRYYLPKLEQEIRFLNEKGYSQSGSAEAAWSKGLRSLLSGELKSALDDNKVFLLRLGKHGGAEDKTLNGVRSIKIMRGKGEKPESRDKTTEVRLAAQAVNDEKELLPFGWVLVEVGKQSLPNTMAFIDEMAKPAYALKEKEQIRQNKLVDFKQKMQEEECSRKAEAEERANQKALAEKQYAERQAALAAMSPQELMLETLNEKWEAEKAINRKQLGGELDTLVGNCVKSGVDWSGEDKRKLHRKCKEILTWLGKDKKKTKEKLAPLNIMEN